MDVCLFPHSTVHFHSFFLLVHAEVRQSKQARITAAKTRNAACEVDRHVAANEAWPADFDNTSTELNRETEVNYPRTNTIHVT